MIEPNVEQALLMCLFLDENEEYVNLDQVKEGFFSIKEHENILRKIKDLRSQGIGYDTVLAKEKAGFTGKELSYLYGAFEYMNTIVGAKRYFKALKRRYLEKEIRKVVNRDIDPMELQIKIDELMEHDTNQKEIFSTQKQLSNYLDNFEQRASGNLKKFNTGFPELNKILGILYEGNLMIVGGRTSTGKTSLLLKMAYNMAKQGRKILYISAEMSSHQLIDRMVSFSSELNLFAILNSKLDKNEQDKFNRSCQKLYEMPINIIEISSFTEKEVAGYIKRTGADVVLFDYIQRFRLPDRYDTRASAFANISNSMKSIAVDNKVLVISASQLSREVDRRPDKQVGLIDLKESGGLEESADSVILIEKTEVVKQSKDVVKLKIAKNRNGACGYVLIGFKKEYCNFEEFTDERY